MADTLYSSKVMKQIHYQGKTWLRNMTNVFTAEISKIAYSFYTYIYMFGTLNLWTQSK